MSSRPESVTADHFVLVGPGRIRLQRALETMARAANGRHGVRTVEPLPWEPVLQQPHGLMLANGHSHRHTHRSMWPTSAVGVAWFTRPGKRKVVRAWGSRGRVSGPRHSLTLVPAPDDQEGLSRCWAETFPLRAQSLRQRRIERLLRILERFGPPGEDDRSNLWPGRTLIRTHVPGIGLLLSDDYRRPQRVQVVVTDPSTGQRHYLTVPPRFGDLNCRTFQRLGTAERRIRAAVAWTFGLQPEEYAPALEA